MTPPATHNHPQPPQPPANRPDAGPVLDLIFVVADARAWHLDNLALNPDHYPWLARCWPRTLHVPDVPLLPRLLGLAPGDPRSLALGPEAVVGIAEAIGVGVHFNTLVPIDGRVVKYGVIEAGRLVRELTGWRQLFVAGRMHKPMAELPVAPPSTAATGSSSTSSASSSAPAGAGPEGTSGQGGDAAAGDLAAARASNLRSALATALLQLPGSFSTDALLRGVCALSYNGDVRMGLAEDPHKVERIVQGSRLGLEEMYLPLLQSTASTASTTPTTLVSLPTAPSPSTSPPSPPTPPFSGITRLSENAWQQDTSYGARLALLRSLPVGLLHEVSRRLGLSVPESHLQMRDTLREITAKAMLHEGSHPLQYQRLVSQSLCAIVRRSSAAQAVSGALAAGGGKAVEYMVAKVRKAGWMHSLRSRLRARGA